MPLPDKEIMVRIISLAKQLAIIGFLPVVIGVSLFADLLSLRVASRDV